ncbi:MAG: hypothetical protein VB021_07925 [Oscillospiraceae bacterium]|nr:hypothetical protein [Oscillospiraceae bacterium]
MRGVNKKIIEITDPEDQDIEKVIVFLRPGSSASLKKSRETARSMVAGLCCAKRGAGRWLWAAAAALALCAGIFLLLCFL